MSEGTPRAVTVAHYVRDTVLAVLLFAIPTVLVVWGIHNRRPATKERPSPVLRCPVCGAELELKRVERSKK